MTKKLYVINRHDEMDSCHRPDCIVNTEAEAIKVVKYLNETDGLNIVCEEDGSLADICDDDAIWYDYSEVEVIDDINTIINKE